VQILFFHILQITPVKHNTHFCNVQVYVSRLVHLQSGCEARTIKAVIADSEIYLAILAKVSNRGTRTKSFKVGTKRMVFTEEKNDIGESLLPGLLRIETLLSGL